MSSNLGRKKKDILLEQQMRGLQKEKCDVWSTRGKEGTRYTIREVYTTGKKGLQVGYEMVGNPTRYKSGEDELALMPEVGKVPNVAVAPELAVVNEAPVALVGNAGAPSSKNRRWFSRSAERGGKRGENGREIHAKLTGHDTMMCPIPRVASRVPLPAVIEVGSVAVFHLELSEEVGAGDSLLAEIAIKRAGALADVEDGIRPVIVKVARSWSSGERRQISASVTALIRERFQSMVERRENENKAEGGTDQRRFPRSRGASSSMPVSGWWKEKGGVARQKPGVADVGGGMDLESARSPQMHQGGRRRRRGDFGMLGCRARGRKRGGEGGGNFGTHVWGATGSLLVTTYDLQPHRLARTRGGTPRAGTAPRGSIRPRGRRGRGGGFGIRESASLPGASPSPIDDPDRGGQVLNTHEQMPEAPRGGWCSGGEFEREV
ncbi:hypothetical protein B0H10DRAFT_1961023 [Mycena sp. CBHHK59/15]|nr:hypothetical protein B0H10DRAFT_1961023 [Mycena sp. CBHHK59/15]